MQVFFCVFGKIFLVPCLGRVVPALRWGLVGFGLAGSYYLLGTTTTHLLFGYL